MSLFSNDPLVRIAHILIVLCVAKQAPVIYKHQEMNALWFVSQPSISETTEEQDSDQQQNATQPG